MSIENVLKEDDVNKIIVSYDIETEQDNSEHLHKPMLLISHTVCDKCYDVESRTKIDLDCDICGIQEHIFWGLIQKVLRISIWRLFVQ